MSFRGIFKINNQNKIHKKDQNEQKYSLVGDTKILGDFREKRAQSFVIKNWKWKCFKANERLDKFHDIDLVAWNDHQLAFIQVKSLKMIDKLKPSTKAIAIAKQHNAALYYFFVGEANERIYTKRIKWE